MSHLDVIRAWKDEEYRLSLSEAEQALLPENPAGLIELADADLVDVSAAVGGAGGAGGAGGPGCFLSICQHTICSVTIVIGN